MIEKTRPGNGGSCFWLTIVSASKAGKPDWLPAPSFFNGPQQTPSAVESCGVALLLGAGRQVDSHNSCMEVSHEEVLYSSQSVYPASGVLTHLGPVYRWDDLGDCHRPEWRSGPRGCSHPLGYHRPRAGVNAIQGEPPRSRQRSSLAPVSGLLRSPPARGRPSAPNALGTELTWAPAVR